MGLYRNGRKIAGNGKSPYEAAISGGYIGTEKQFYESLGKLDEVMNLQEEIEHIKNTSFSSIFKVKNITLTPELFTNNIYTIQNTHVTEDSILITYYSPTTLDTATELQLVEESVENGIKFTIQNPLETFTIEIDAIVVMNLDEAKDDTEKPTITPDNIANNTTTTVAGYAADARQLNPEIDDSYANTVSKQFLQMQQQIQALQNSLNGCSFEIIDGIPHIVWNDEGDGNTPTPDSTITITSQPAGTNVYVGESFHLSVEANSSSELSYQWRYRANDSDEWTNSTNPTAKTANFTSAITSEVGTNQWQCVISNNDKTMTTDIVMIEVREIPSITITQQPQNTEVEQGGNWEMTITAESELPLTYQWYQKQDTTGSFTAFANGTTNSITGIMASDAAIGAVFYIKCKISNGMTEIESNSATLIVLKTIDSTITITKQPSNIAITEGDTITLSVEATSELPLRYRWVYRPLGSDDRFIEIPGATSESWTGKLPDGIGTGDFQAYCVIKNDKTDIASEMCTISITTGKPKLLKIEATHANDYFYFTVIADRPIPNTSILKWTFVNNNEGYIADQGGCNGQETERTNFSVFNRMVLGSRYTFTAILDDDNNNKVTKQTGYDENGYITFYN